MGEIIFHVIFIAVLGIFFKESLLIDTGRSADPIGPAGFPQAIIIFTLILLVISLFQSVRKWSKRDKSAPSEQPAELNKVFIGILVIISGYVLIVDTLGFIISTSLFFLVLFALLGRKINLMEMGRSVVFSLGFTIVFGTILNLQLPRGIEALKSISYLIY